MPDPTPHWPLHGIDADEAELKRHLVYKSIARRVLLLAHGAMCATNLRSLRSVLLEPNGSSTHLVSKSCSVGVVSGQ